MKKTPTLTRARFFLDESPTWEGWHVVGGGTWNGWANPAFTFETCVEIAAYVHALDWEGDWRIVFNEETRTIIDFGVFGDGTEYVVPTVTLENGTVLYSLGNRGWCWDYTTRDDDRPRRFIVEDGTAMHELSTRATFDNVDDARAFALAHFESQMNGDESTACACDLCAPGYRVGDWMRDEYVVRVVDSSDYHTVIEMDATGRTKENN